MSNQPKFSHNPDNADRYHIRVAGHLGQQWESWFGNMEIVLEETGSTLMVCKGMDQAALHGLLKKIRDLGITLLSVERIVEDQEDAHPGEG